MFVSLNKKFIYTIAAFFILTSTIFLWTFYILYETQLQKAQKASFIKNHQFSQLLTDNVNLKQKLGMKTNLNDFDEEKRQIKNFMDSYNNRYLALTEGVKIIVFSATLLAFMILLLWILIKKWVVKPINNLSQITNIVAEGNLSARIIMEDNSIFKDEMTKLAMTFNQMLGRLQENITLIQNNTDFLQDLVDNIPDGIRVFDDKYNIILANKEYYKQIGKTKKSKAYFDIQNSTKPLAVNSALLKINGKPCTVESIRDLSEDIQFSHQQKLASLGFLATAVAHEMKNHLGSIKMITETLLDKQLKNNDQSENAKYMPMIYKQVVECLAVPERLLNLVKISNEKLVKIDCEKNIKEVVDLLDYELKNNGITIQTTFSKNTFMMGNEADFKMILINLCLNALKAMPSGGKLDIETQTLKQKIIITIKDNGIGISPENIKHIFEPFFSNQDKTNHRGTGLGLAIVKSIVEKFKGQVNVSSKQGGGTSFELTFKRIDV